MRPPKHTHSAPFLSYLCGATLWCRYFPQTGGPHATPPNIHTPHPFSAICVGQLYGADTFPILGDLMRPPQTYTHTPHPFSAICVGQLYGADTFPILGDLMRPPQTYTHTPHPFSAICVGQLYGADTFPILGDLMRPPQTYTLRTLSQLFVWGNFMVQVLSPNWGASCDPHKHTHTLRTLSQLFVWGNFMVQVLSPNWGGPHAHTHFPSFLQCPITNVLLPWQHSFMCLWFDVGGDRSTRLCLLVLSLSWFSWMPLLLKEISLLVSVLFCTVVNEMLSVPV